jgi:hypothetical protein
MSPGETIDTALKLYQQLGLQMLRLTVIPALMCFAGLFFLGEYVVPAFFQTNFRDNITAQLGEVAVTSLVALLVAAPLYLAGASYSTLIAVSLASDYMRGDSPDVGRAVRTAADSAVRMFRVSLRILFKSLGGVLLSTLIMGLGALLSMALPESIWAGLIALVGIFGLAASWIWFAMVLSQNCLAGPICVVEDLEPKESLARSRELMKRNGSQPGGGQTFWYTIFLFLIIDFLFEGGIELAAELTGAKTALFDLVAGWPLGSVLATAVTYIPSFLATWVLVPAMSSLVTVLYFERRIRREGYDIESLAAQIRPTAEDIRRGAKRVSAQPEVGR